LSYSWTFLSVPPGSSVTDDSLSDSTAPDPNFTPDAIGNYVLQLTVADGLGGSDSDDVVITAVLPPPNAPNSLTAAAVSPTQIDLNWQDNSDNEDGFKIERKIEGGNYSQIAAVGANTTSYSDTGLTPEFTYFYRVRAFNAGGDSDYSNEASATTPPGQTSAAFRVDLKGRVYSNRAFYCGLSSNCFNVGVAADIAERIFVSEPVEPGDVVEVDPDNPKHYRKARNPYSTLVAGVIVATSGFILANLPEELSLIELFQNVQPAKLLLSLTALPRKLPAPRWSVAALAEVREREVEQGEIRVSIRQLLKWQQPSIPGRPLLALMGRVKVKATTENGPIEPGDLLVSASTPGYVMRCPDSQQCEGTIVGKALEPLDKGAGLILMLLVR
jgi:hypothetical protein